MYILNVILIILEIHVSMKYCADNIIFTKCT